MLRPGPSDCGAAVQEAVEVQAERLVAAGLKRRGWTEEDVRSRRKGEATKVKLAEELRAKTTMPLAWIAQRLCIGSRGYLTWLLQHRGQRRESAPGTPRRLKI